VCVNREELGDGTAALRRRNTCAHLFINGKGRVRECEAQRAAASEQLAPSVAPDGTNLGALSFVLVMSDYFSGHGGCKLEVY
jgi:hypothetical protein